MIERPKRAVTRFFVPLIDVLILLFCIFLLMPFISQPGAADEGKKELTPEQIRQELTTLRLELDRSRQDVRKLQEERTNPAGRVSVHVFEIDPNDGRLFHYILGSREYITNQRQARDAIGDHQRLARLDGKEPLFLILLPHEAKAGVVKFDRLREYKFKWFEGVPFKFENAHNYEVP